MAFASKRYVFHHLGEKRPVDVGPIYQSKMYRALVEEFPPQTWTGEEWAPVNPDEVMNSIYKSHRTRQAVESSAKPPRGEREAPRPNGPEPDEDSEVEEGEVKE